jgi:ribosome-binding factor A
LKSPLPYKRAERVGHQLLEILGEIRQRHFDLSGLGFITFTRVVVSSDLKSAKVFFSVFQPKIDQHRIESELNRLRKSFKKYLAPELHIKNIPDLRFYYDDSIAYQERLKALFKSLDSDTES